MVPNSIRRLGKGGVRRLVSLLVVTVVALSWAVTASAAAVLASTVGVAQTSSAALPAPRAGSYQCSHGTCSGLVTISQKRSIYLTCRGSGSPTVVLVAGRSDQGQIWQAPTGDNGPAVFSSVAGFTRVCAYDRPGSYTIRGDRVTATSSTPVSQPTTAADGVKDLHALLSAAKVPGPYLMVAHSYGGLIARLYTSTYPDQVSGFVSVDTLTELMYPELGSAANQLLWLRLNNNYVTPLDPYHQERTDLLASFQQVQLAPPMRPMPALVLSADEPFDFKALIKQGILPDDTPTAFSDTVWNAVVIGQQKLAALLAAQQIKDTYSGHYIHLTQPQLVINSIRHVYDQIHGVADPSGLTLTPVVPRTKHAP
jgi:pimeloyl-ACP methyl ester carboxylesterase